MRSCRVETIVRFTTKTIVYKIRNSGNVCFLSRCEFREGNNFLANKRNVKNSYQLLRDNN